MSSVSANPQDGVNNFDLFLETLCLLHDDICTSAVTATQQTEVCNKCSLEVFHVFENVLKIYKMIF